MCTSNLRMVEVGYLIEQADTVAKAALAVLSDQLETFLIDVDILFIGNIF